MLVNVLGSLRKVFLLYSMCFPNTPSIRNFKDLLKEQMEVVMKVSFLCLLFPLLIKAKNDCSASSFCGGNYFNVRFPFQFTRGDNHCGYPGFNLSCNNQGQVILNFPNSGNFYVRNIDYRAQVVQLYDPFRCLPSRLLSLNLSGSPFKASKTQNYTYISCPSNETVGRFTSIDCLSNSSTSIIATSSTSLVERLTSKTACQIVAVVPIPVVQLPQYYDELSSALSQDLHLSWDTPDCRECEASGHICRFANSSRQYTICSYDKTGGRGGVQMLMIIALFIALPGITCSTILLCFMCVSRRRRANGINSQQNLTLATVVPETPPVTQGLDESTIESYIKVILGESMRVPGLNGGTCPICLADYTAKESVRCIPECKHCFHAECIDEWLRLKGTCPVCRNSPSPVHPHS